MGIHKLYFEITRDILPEDADTFPFSIYTRLNRKSSYELFLGPNTLFDEDKKVLLDELEEKNAKMYVRHSQKRTFLKFLNLREGDIPSLRQQQNGMDDAVLDTLFNEDLFDDGSGKPKGVESKGNFELDWKSEDDEDDEDTRNILIGMDNKINDAIIDNNFLEVIKSVQEEVSNYDPGISPSVSFARKLAILIMNKDNFVNRVTAISYLLARTLNIKDPDELCSLFCAAMTYRIGLTQFLGLYSFEVHNQFNEKQMKEFLKYGHMSEFMLKQNEYTVGDRVIRIIQDHRERADGNGYPSGKFFKHIDPLSLVLGITDHFFDFTDGKITGDNVDFLHAAQQYAAKKIIKGVQYNFGEELYRTFSMFMRIKKQFY